MKMFYFVRHGESVGNATGVHRGPSDELTERGREQARFLAERFRSISVEVILASHYKRAQETAQIIADAIKLPVGTLELLAEKRAPSQTLGKPPDDPARVELEKIGTEKTFSETWRYSDEENFADLKKRALKLLKLLPERREENLLLVTHGWFLRVLIGTMIHGDELTGEGSYRLWKFLGTKNTGITLCTHDKSSLNNPWRMLTWMDRAHLGETH